VLNSRNVFGVPAMASSFFNIGSIVGGVALAWWIDPTFDSPKALIGLAIGTLVGGALQLAVQLPALHRVGYRFRFDFAWRDEGVREVLRQMGPAIIAASSVQVNCDGQRLLRELARTRHALPARQCLSSHATAARPFRCRARHGDPPLVSRMAARGT
jgi:hypothetical protein